MSKKLRNIHLICNAHLDPVWLWEMPEGMGEALSTFRTAAEMCEANPGFIFNHNESILYEWVLEYEPGLFKRIQKLVKAGSWNIMGGWFLQPDCNMPSGESFVRQVQEGREFFKKHFGKDVKTAINFDPFGHSRGMVQVLAKCGYDSYLFGRPRETEIKLPGEDFVWVGFDGSEICARRFHGWYNTQFGQARKEIEERLANMPEGDEPVAILWGVGNHGGGPSRNDLRDINKLIKDRDDLNVMHSTPQNYFKEMRKYRDSLPKFERDINPWATGCYTTMVRIKQKHRQIENALYSVEKMVSAAVMNGLMKYPEEDLKQIEYDLLLGEFHDSLPGSSIEPTEEGLLNMFGHGLEIAQRLRTKAFFELARGQKRAKEGEIPVLVYNSQGFGYDATVECEFNRAEHSEAGKWVDVEVYQGKKKLVCQVEKEDANVGGEWRKRVVFNAYLEPGMNRFDCRCIEYDKKPVLKLKRKGSKIKFKGKDIEVDINTRTGLIDKWRVKGRDCVRGRAFEPLVMEDNADSWEMRALKYSKVAGKFSLMNQEDGTAFSGVYEGKLDSVRVIEDGELRSVVESLFSYNNSFIVMRYKLPKFGTEIEVDCRVYWNEKDKMLKLGVPLTVGDGRYIGQTAYGAEELKNNGNEVVAQKWTAVNSQEDNFTVTAINDGIYGSDYSSKGIRLTLIRGCGYSTGPSEGVILPQPDRFSPRIDQGERKFKFWFNAGSTTERMKHVDRESLVHNEREYALTFFPKGNDGSRPKAGVTVSGDVVEVITVKKAMKGSAFIVRLYEPSGRARKVKVNMPATGKRMTVKLDGYEVVTLKVNPRSGKSEYVDLMEKPVKR